MSVNPASAPVGTEVDTVYVEIDYAILQHFSKHLYSSPNKAVEELVTNGYDALAQRVDVFLPGSWARDCLLVWDDGESMDIEGLRHLWWIARSPKEDTAGVERLAVSADGRTSRRMIGKFGIGKLASYAVGNRLTHLCRQGDRYLLVSVDYAQAPPLSDDPDRERGFHTPVRELDEATAAAYTRSLLRTVPDNVDALLARPHWTLAVVDELKDDVALTQGRLRWVLGNGMPLRPDFQVWVNTEQVQPTLEKAALVDWNLATPEVTAGLRAQWTDAGRRGLIGGAPAFGTGFEEGESVDGGATRRRMGGWQRPSSLGPTCRASVASGPGSGCSTGACTKAGRPTGAARASSSTSAAGCSTPTMPSCSYPTRRSARSTACR